MYPNGENASGAFDSLSPDTFKYVISAKDHGLIVAVMRSRWLPASQP